MWPFEDRPEITFCRECGLAFRKKDLKFWSVSPTSLAWKYQDEYSNLCQKHWDEYAALKSWENKVLQWAWMNKEQMDQLLLLSEDKKNDIGGKL